MTVATQLTRSNFENVGRREGRSVAGDIADNVESSEEGSSLGRLCVRCRDFDPRGLSGAVRTEEPNDLTRLGAEAGAADHSGPGIGGRGVPDYADIGRVLGPKRRDSRKGNGRGARRTRRRGHVDLMFIQHLSICN